MAANPEEQFENPDVSGVFLFPLQYVLLIFFKVRRRGR